MRQFYIRHSPVILQVAQDAPVDPVELDPACQNMLSPGYGNYLTRTLHSAIQAHGLRGDAA
jgi:hypothetical protein